VQPAVVVHEASVRRVRELSNFRPGECVSISSGHGPGSGWENRPLPISRNYKKKQIRLILSLLSLKISFQLCPHLPPFPLPFQEQF